ncbi:hypothetical protein C8J57DRAFT_1714636 [Mycena rebaudengoi]|nr:hypothetical protein C8J57DRAFT_1714636 [Mycena rebaudengoi]
MPVMTRRMRKAAGLPDLPSQYPVDVPKTCLPAPSNANLRAIQRGGRGEPGVVQRSMFPIRISSPTVLQYPNFFDSPSPLTSCHTSSSSSSSSSLRSHSRSNSSAAADFVYALHPGIQTLQKHKPVSDARGWEFQKEPSTKSVRMRRNEPPDVYVQQQPPFAYLSERTPGYTSVFGHEWEKLRQQSESSRGSTESGSSTESGRRGSSASISSSDRTIRGSSSGASTAVQPRTTESATSRSHQGSSRC